MKAPRAQKESKSMSSNTIAAKNKSENIRTETDSLGQVNVPSDKLWGAQTQRSLEHFSIGQDLIPREMISAYATPKKAAANANHAGRRLNDEQYKLIVQTCDEILAGQHADYVVAQLKAFRAGDRANDPNLMMRATAVKLTDKEIAALAEYISGLH